MSTFNCDDHRKCTGVCYFKAGNYLKAVALYTLHLIVKVIQLHLWVMTFYTPLSMEFQLLVVIFFYCGSIHIVVLLLPLTNMNDCWGICNVMHITRVETVDSYA